MPHKSDAKHHLYYEAILQLREVSSAALDAVKKELHQRGIGIAYFKEVKNGYDYYLADSKATITLGKNLQQRFGGELAITATLFSRKDGKNIYRMTILFRQAGFKKGEAVRYRGEHYQVQAVGKHIILQQEGKKNIKLRYGEMKAIRKV